MFEGESQQSKSEALDEGGFGGGKLSCKEKLEEGNMYPGTPPIRNASSSVCFGSALALLTVRATLPSLSAI